VETITDQLDDSWDSIHLLSTNDQHTPERAEQSTTPSELNFQTTEKGRQTTDTVPDDDNELIYKLLKKE
jgi:hypothetical protein